MGAPGKFGRGRVRQLKPLLFIGWLTNLAAFTPAGAEVMQAFDLQTPYAPVLADADGARQLAYELHITNFASREIRIDRITLLEPDGAVIGAAEGDELARWLVGTGRQKAADTRTVPSGARVVAYFNLPVTRATPATVAHRIDFHFAEGDDRTAKQLTGPAVAVDPQPPVTLGPPLRGGPWAAVYAPQMERGHRRVFYATQGAARIPGRFAIDWIRLDAHGRSAPEGATRLDEFHGYDAEVLAVADATVAAVRDDMAEAETLDAIPAVSIGDASGNYVSLDLGDGRYAFYEHLKRGILVRPGQRVRRGEVIGHLGLTGQGSGPHLHFHVANAGSLLDAEGLPFVLDGVEVIGGYPSIEAFVQGGPWMPSTASGPQRPFTPRPNAVIRFPD